jgi:predicted acyl esterase
LLDDARVQLAIRHGSGFTWRNECEWPLARTKWTRFYLDAADKSIGERVPDSSAHVRYNAPEGGVTFVTAPLAQETEVTGPLALRLWVASTSTEMDLFVTIRNLDPGGDEVACVGSNNEPVPLTKGWLRVSHRKLDPERSSEYRPYHLHDEIEPLIPGEIVPVDVELWPTSMVFEAGHRLALDIEAHDGVGPGLFRHDDPDDRHPSLLAGINTIYTGTGRLSYLLLPVIPRK